MITTMNFLDGERRCVPRRGHFRAVPTQCQIQPTVDFGPLPQNLISHISRQQIAASFVNNVFGFTTCSCTCFFSFFFLNRSLSASMERFSFRCQVLNLAAVSEQRSKPLIIFKQTQKHTRYAQRLCTRSPRFPLPF